MQIVTIENADKRKYLDLLMLADPDRVMLEKYLMTCEMFAVKADDGEIAAACCMTKAEADEIELKNLSTLPQYENNGFASALIKHVTEYYSGQYSYMILGTSSEMIPFYGRFGFEYTHTVKDFFKNNYTHPIIENGQVLKDMQYLKRALK